MSSSKKANRKSGGKRPKAVQAPTSALGDSLREEILHFMEYHPARRVNRNLRKMLLEFLMHDGAREAIYLQDLLYDLEGLFELLDAMEIEGNEG